MADAESKSNVKVREVGFGALWADSISAHLTDTTAAEVPRQAQELLQAKLESNSHLPLDNLEPEGCGASILLSLIIINTIAEEMAQLVKCTLYRLELLRSIPQALSVMPALGVRWKQENS
jgi:hypothetical protein